MKLQPSQLLSANNRSNTTASSASSQEGSIFDRLRGSTDSASQGQSMSDSDSALDQGHSPFESITIEHDSVVAMLGGDEMDRGYAVGDSAADAVTDDDNTDQVSNEPVSVTITTFAGDVEVEITPNESWEELPSDAVGGAAVAIVGGQAVVVATTGAPPLTVPVVVALGATGAVGGVVSGTDTDFSVTPNIFSTGLAMLANLWAGIGNPATPNPLTSATTSSESDGSGMTSAESAEAGNWGTDPEGEFGGTPTQPAAEPAAVQRPTSNQNSDNDSNGNSNGGGSMSSSESAESAGYGSSEGGEFG